MKASKFVSKKAFLFWKQQQQKTVHDLIRHNQVLTHKLAAILASRRYYAQKRLPLRDETAMKKLQAEYKGKLLTLNQLIARVGRIHLTERRTKQRLYVVKLTRNEYARLFRLIGNQRAYQSEGGTLNEQRKKQQHVNGSDDE